MAVCIGHGYRFGRLLSSVIAKRFQFENRLYTLVSTATVKRRTFSSSICHLNNLPQHKLDNDTNPSLHVASDTKDEEAAATEILQNLKAEEAKKLKVLKMEYDIYMSLGKAVPEEMTNTMWLEVFRECPTVSSRKRYYKFALREERLKKRHAAKKIENAKAMLQRKAERSAQIIEPKNTIFFYIREATMKQHYYSNLAHSMVFGTPIVLDFGFDEGMTKREIVNLCSQTQNLHHVNKVLKEPFHLHICNLDPAGSVYTPLVKAFRNLDEVPMTVTSKSYLDLFPKEKLVYLTPHTRNSLTDFNHDDIYIIGGLVQLGADVPLTLAKAKKENIRMAKLPLESYLKFRGGGGKSLTLDQMMKIMTDLKDGSEWKKALQAVPTRKADWCS